ncbi:hypothetical protein MTBLM1_30312 [Rhodospirillaceae bacterium LM-1]|nr:hypothetical protein MTBLM1_30312 [Rhodospirillaceae bacterium LM-1]
MQVAERTPFQLSRIVASGWGAGRIRNADDLIKIDALANSLNQHQSFDDKSDGTRALRTTPVTTYVHQRRFTAVNRTKESNHGNRSEAQWSRTQKAENGSEET